MENTLRIIGIDIQNFKRIELFRCKFGNSGIVTFGGENAQGKSSIIDALHAALVGVPKSLTNPVRDGEDTAHIRVTIGNGENVEYKVIRTFHREGSPLIRVVGPNDAQISNGSAVLKELLSQNSVDPIAFLNLQPIEQRNQLAKLVGLDLAEYDVAIENARARERELDKYQASLAAKVEDMAWHEDAPEAEINSADLANKLAEAAAHNAKASMFAQRVVDAEQAVERSRSDIVTQQQRIASIEQQLEEARRQLTDLNADLSHREKNVEAIKAEAANFASIDTEALRAQLDSVEAENQKVRDNAARLKARDDWQAAERDLHACIAERKAKEEAKRKALASAKFPVDGLSFDAQTIVYNGQPFAQASMAERIRVATAISLAMRGRVAPIFIRDASTLDAKSLQIIEELAEKHGAQVFAEIVANRTDDGFDKDCTFYVVEGKLAEPAEVA